MDRDDNADELSIPADPKLIAEGWVRRHLADPARARESVELYTSMGYEVKVQTLTPSDFGPQCGQCAAVACGSCVLIYTRNRFSS
ncbi:MAG: hypothetical protein ACYS0G_00395 [Planctomycetota bacterium]